MIKSLACFLLAVFCLSCQQPIKNTELTGAVFGTSYTIIYDKDVDYGTQIDSLFDILNKSLSTYQVDSDISKLNRNEPVKVDAHFVRVFEASMDIYRKTEGVFDPTIGALVNAWDFGPGGKILKLDTLKIDSMKRNVGMDKVTLLHREVRKLPGTFLDFNAIAKGYAVDVIAEFLGNEGVGNYFVFIGGEVRTKGRNEEKKRPWVLGIQKPNFDGLEIHGHEVFLSDEAMATSGTYRKFKIDDNGNRYAHIISPKTGYPSKTNVLSVSVVANNCMTADAYATAFQAMGVEKVKAFLKKHPELKAFLIFENENMELETLSLNGL